MKQEPNTQKVKRFSEKQQGYVNNHGVIAMKRMKIDAAAVCLKNWIGQQVIQINQHSCHKNQIGFFPFIPKEKQCYNQRKAKVQEVMDESLHCVGENILDSKKNGSVLFY